ncbi:ABC transporter substrate-binding protein [Chitinibacter sp. ZOR0017]|uniref:substrate-binding periplasmic protein n=1 Tax=Chitinibacter sp. ZOR0017 TaxID=1339254 RepID=UPI00064777AE|nr:transporter substrate-binding domain-containing protein [Chitinibacter sp. ZOR0017]
MYSPRHWVSLICFCALVNSPSWAGETLRICAENDWKPYSFAKQGQAAGASVELISAALNQQRMAFTIDSGSYNRCLKLTQAGHYDAVLNVAKTSERQNQFVWPQLPYLHVKLHLLAHSKLAKTSTEYGVLAGKRIGTTAGYEYPEKMFLQKDIKLIESHSELASLRRLAAGNIDFILISQSTYQAQQKLLNNAENAGISDWGLIDNLALYVAFSPKLPDAGRWTRALDAGLAELQKRGEDKAIFNRWHALY